jgi:hypothetical protein
MFRMKKVALVTAVMLLIIATLLGCSVVMKDDFEESDWYIKLNINPTATAKAITVTEYDVTELAIEVYDPQGVLIEEISWQVAEGQQSYLIPVSEQGQYEIVVTHIGEENGEVVEAEESALFNIQAMVITVIDIIPGYIGVINIEPGGEQPQEDGTVTVTLTEADVANGHCALVGVYPAGTDPGIDPMGKLVAMGNFEVVSGYGSMTLTETGDYPQPVWYGTGGKSYDVYIWVDMNDNLEYGVYWQEPGIDLQLSSFPVVVVIDGDVYLNYTGSDFVVTPDP